MLLKDSNEISEEAQKSLITLIINRLHRRRELGVVFESSPNDGNVNEHRTELTGAA